MQLIFECTIPGIPVAKQGDRTAIMGKQKKFIHHYQPKEVVTWAAYSKGEIAKAWGNKPLINDTMPLILDVWFYFPPVSGLSKKKESLLANGHSFPKITKPDLENLLKNLCDCLQGIVVHNDARFCDAQIHKRITNTPRTEIKIYEYEE